MVVESEESYTKEGVKLTIKIVYALYSLAIKHRENIQEKNFYA
jgi:hypothetical protein